MHLVNSHWMEEGLSKVLYCYLSLAHLKYVVEMSYRNYREKKTNKELRDLFFHKE